jgi:hypothetical protein
MYGERASRLSGAVVWAGTARTGVQRVLPDGCMDLIWSEAGLLVAGPDTRAFLAAGPPGAHYVGLRFAPGTGPAVLGIPAHALRDDRVPLDAIWPGAEAGRLAERMGASPGGTSRPKAGGGSWGSRRPTPSTTLPGAPGDGVG